MNVALLRAVNLPGHNKVRMAELCAMLAELKLEGGRALLQSGNLIFRSTSSTSAQLERVLEDGTKKRLGIETDFFVRSAADWKAMIAANPFAEEAQRDPSHLLVMFMKKAPDRERVASLQGAIKDREVVGVSGRHAYLVYPDGIGRSRLTTALIEKNLATRGTARNWNTVLKLAALVL